MMNSPRSQKGKEEEKKLQKRLEARRDNWNGFIQIHSPKSPSPTNSSSSFFPPQNGTLSSPKAVPHHLKRKVEEKEESSDTEDDVTFTSLWTKTNEAKKPKLRTTLSLKIPSKDLDETSGLDVHQNTPK